MLWVFPATLADVKNIKFFRQVADDQILSFSGKFGRGSDIEFSEGLVRQKYQ